MIALAVLRGTSWFGMSNSRVRSEVYNNKGNSSGKILCRYRHHIPWCNPGWAGSSAARGTWLCPCSQQLQITTQKSSEWSSSHGNELQQCVNYTECNNFWRRTITLVSLALSNRFVQKFSSTPLLLFAYIVEALLSFCTCFVPQSHGAQTFSPRTERVIWLLDTLRNTGQPYWVCQHIFWEKYPGKSFSQVFDAVTVCWTPGPRAASVEAQIYLRSPTTPSLTHHVAEQHTCNTASSDLQWIF